VQGNTDCSAEARNGAGAQQEDSEIARAGIPDNFAVGPGWLTIEAARGPGAIFATPFLRLARSSFCPIRNKPAYDPQMDSAHTGTSMWTNRSVVLDPEELSLLGSIFDRAVESLPAAMRTAANRTEIARNILGRAALGDRDPALLELAAFSNFVATAA
jgi:hypothetical protein